MKIREDDFHCMDEIWDYFYACRGCKELSIIRSYDFCPYCGAKIEWVKTLK